MDQLTRVRQTVRAHQLIDRTIKLGLTGEDDALEDVLSKWEAALDEWEARLGPTSVSEAYEDARSLLPAGIKRQAD